MEQNKRVDTENGDAKLRQEFMSDKHISLESVLFIALLPMLIALVVFGLLAFAGVDVQ